jgi:hypothetical protein
MPRFLTISPTHVSGKKEYAWNKFLSGGYVAIGWLPDHDLTGFPIDDVINLIRSENYDNEASAIDSFNKFLTLEKGDYVAVNNAISGLFGVGVISSGYKYEKYKHDTGADAQDHFYSHYRLVEWIYTSYVKRKDLISPSEKSWKPFGTVGSLYDEVPPYIWRLLGKPLEPAEKVEAEPFLVPDNLQRVIKSVNHVRSDTGHQERDHESLVESFFIALGYEKHKDIKFRRGRMDLSLRVDGKALAVVEVKRDWNLSQFNISDALKQVYYYALDHGVRYVIVTNGDYYAVYDRLKGLSYSSNQIGEFNMTNLKEEDIELIQRLSKENLMKPRLEELFMYLSENFITEEG